MPEFSNLDGDKEFVLGGTTETHRSHMEQNVKITTPTTAQNHKNQHFEPENGSVYGARVTVQLALKLVLFTSSSAYLRLYQSTFSSCCAGF